MRYRKTAIQAATAIQAQFIVFTQRIRVLHQDINLHQMTYKKIKEAVSDFTADHLHLFQKSKWKNSHRQKRLTNH